MATLSDYVVIIDGTATMVRGGTNYYRQTFNVPNNLNQSAKAIFMYRVEADNANDLKYTMDLNGQDVLTLTHSTNRFGTIHEVISGTAIRTGENKFQVVATGGTGTLKVSDVVVFFQVNA